MDSLILVADSGASKTDWACIVRNSGPADRVKYCFVSQGYNPNYISGEDIVKDIRLNLPEGFPCEEVAEIYFYGAGVTPLQYPFMTKTLKQVFTQAGKVHIAMDTLASCRALLGTRPGFAAILGTGANTCLYDGRDEYFNVDSCGFILGDEGSGGYLGKRLITDFIRHNMPENVYELVDKALGYNNDELLDIIYTRPFPNRFCAGYARFIRENMDFDPYFPELVTDAFRKFFERIVTHYEAYQTYDFNAVGSVAYYFRDWLEPVVKEFGMKVGKIVKAPMEGLVEYHSSVSLE